MFWDMFSSRKSIIAIKPRGGIWGGGKFFLKMYISDPSIFSCIRPCKFWLVIKGLSSVVSWNLQFFFQIRNKSFVKTIFRNDVTFTRRSSCQQRIPYEFVDDLKVNGCEFIRYLYYTFFNEDTQKDFNNGHPCFI